MTIRYICTGCDSVLKIKDEKAGTRGKCPKCKSLFRVPDPDAHDADSAQKLTDGPDTPEESVDMPIELTPEVSDPEESDFGEMVGITPTLARSAAVISSAASDRKPSVAELMKDFEATKKKDRKLSSEVTRPVATVSTAAQTSGSAADAISRSYQQKRDSASAPAASPQEAKAAEERALLVNFLKTRAIPAVVLLLTVGYAYFWWITRVAYEGPPLYSVVGEVQQNGAPAEGYRVEFWPVTVGQNDPRSGATGVTDKEGRFELMYILPHRGAPAGDYEIVILNRQGNPVVPKEGKLEFTVREDGPNEFKASL